MSDSKIYIVDLMISGKKSFFYLLSKWWVVLIFCVAGGLLGILYAWVQEPSYTAELTFSSETGESALGGYAGLAAQFGLDLGGGAGGAFEGDNLMMLLKSKLIIEKTLLSDAKNFGANKLMIDVYIENHQLNKGWSNNPKLKNVHFERNPFAPERSRDSILKAVSKMIVDKQLSIDKMDKKLNYVVVVMRDVNETYARDFVVTLMQNATDFYVGYKSKKAKKNYDLINRMTDSIKGLLYGNIQSYASTVDLNVNPLRAIAKAGSQKIQVNAQANGALYTELLKQLGLSQITLQRETPLIQIIDQPELPLKKEKSGRLFTGIKFAFIALVLCIIFLLIRKWIKDTDERYRQQTFITTA